MSHIPSVRVARAHVFRIFIYSLNRSVTRTHRTNIYCFSNVFLSMRVIGLRARQLEHRFSCMRETIRPDASSEFSRRIFGHRYFNCSLLRVAPDAEPVSVTRNVNKRGRWSCRWRFRLFLSGYNMRGYVLLEAASAVQFTRAQRCQRSISLESQLLFPPEVPDRRRFSKCPERYANIDSARNPTRRGLSLLFRVTVNGRSPLQMHRRLILSAFPRTVKHCSG